MLTEEEARLRRQRYYAERTPEERERYRQKESEWRVKKRAEHIAVRAALGLEPGQRTSVRSPEEAAERKRAKRKELRERDIEKSREADRIKARKLAAKKAIEEGREPNSDLTRPKDARVPQTEDEKREKRRLKQLAWRVKNLERSREIVRESEKRRAAARAIAEGREPGKVGPPRRFTPEEKRAKRKAKTEAYNAANIDEVREKARIREAAKRAGTFVSKALPRLTEEEKRLTEVAWAATRRVRTRANGGKFTRADITWLATAQSGTCLFCGDPLGDEVPHIDHWVPISRGGSNDPDNLALLHQSCNGRKGAKMPADLGFPNDPRVLRAAIQDGLLSATNPVAGD